MVVDSYHELLEKNRLLETENQSLKERVTRAEN
jgi:cell division septum initiation protein DivIVA